MVKLAVVLALSLAAATTAHADDAVDPAIQARADADFEQAQAHYEAGEYQAAIELFKSAYELVHDPVYLFNLAQSYRKVLDCEGAADYYTKYLDQATDAPNRAKVEGWLRELAPCVEQRKTEHEAARKGDEAERARRATADAAALAAIAAAKAPVPKPARPVDHGHAIRLAGLGVAGAGVAGLIVGVGFAAHGASLESEIKSACPNAPATPCNWGAEKTKDAAGARANTIAAVGLVGGGLAAVIGAGLYYYGHSRGRSVEVTPQSHGATVSARFAF